MFLDYSELLNALDSGCTAKITLNNRKINKEEFEQSLLIPMKGDGLDEYRKEYNDMLLSKISGTNNSIYQERYLTFSVHKKNICLEKVPEDLEPLFCIQLFPDGGQLGQMGDDVRSHTCEIGSGFIDVFLVDADGQIAFLVDTVVGTGDLGKEHVIVLFPVLVQTVPFHRDQQGLFQGRRSTEFSI